MLIITLDFGTSIIQGLELDSFIEQVRMFSKFIEFVYGLNNFFSHNPSNEMSGVNKPFSRCSLHACGQNTSPDLHIYIAFVSVIP